MQWDARWQPGQACLYGRGRRFRVEWLRRPWPARGPEVPVHQFVFEAAGYSKPWLMVTSALMLSAARMVEVFIAPAAWGLGKIPQRARAQPAPGPRFGV